MHSNWQCNNYIRTCLSFRVHYDLYWKKTQVYGQAFSPLKIWASKTHLFSSRKKMFSIPSAHGCCVTLYGKKVTEKIPKGYSSTTLPITTVLLVESEMEGLIKQKTKALFTVIYLFLLFFKQLSTILRAKLDHLTKEVPKTTIQILILLTKTCFKLITNSQIVYNLLEH